MDRPGLLDLAIAPLTWLERSRGWKRRGLAFFYLMILLVVGVLGWRELSLWRLPKAPEPFDVAKLGRVEVPDSENAMIAYRAAFARTGEPVYKGYGTDLKIWNVSDWSVADPEVRRWAEDNRHALPIWLPATELRESLLVQPESLEMRTQLGTVQTLRPFVRLALLEGSRLEQDGDLAGAWKHYRAALRASRHAGMHGGLNQRLIGSSFLRQSRPRIEAWTANPKVTPELLRRAIADVEACAAMTSPASEMVRAEYFVYRAAVNTPEHWSKLSDSGPYADSEWYNQVSGLRWAQRFLRNEPKRSHRVLRLITAGYLAQCDRPGPLRPNLMFPQFMIYDQNSTTPAVVRSITPEDLNAWAKDSVMYPLANSSSHFQGLIDAEPGTFDSFRIRMAERAFEIDHGKPPRTYGELLGVYLKALPEGIEPGDSTNATPAPDGP
jgi:hypothetical protein